jgi:hypothetical protein
MNRLLTYRYLISLALFLGLAPFYPQPHLVEKVRMLSAGTLRRPIDVIDLFWHVWPLVLLGYLVVRDRASRKKQQESMKIERG